MRGLVPSSLLQPDALLPPSSGAIIYVDAPIGHIGGTLIIGGGGIVKVGGTSVNQEAQRRPRVYPQQAPPRLIHVEYRISHDAPTGHIMLGGTLSEDNAETHEYSAPRYSGDPTIQDVLAAQRRARRIIRQKVGT